MKNLDIVKYYCYPNNKASLDTYLTMDAEMENLILEAASEFIVNVRLKNNHPFEHWSNHEQIWDFFLKK